MEESSSVTSAVKRGQRHEADPSLAALLVLPAAPPQGPTPGRATNHAETRVVSAVVPTGPAAILPDQGEVIAPSPASGTSRTSAGSPVVDAVDLPFTDLPSPIEHPRW